MLSTNKIGLSGKYVVEKLNNKKEMVDTLEFGNLITNNGLNLMSTNYFAGIVETCSVGSGSTPPQYTDTSLESYINRTNGRWISTVVETTPEKRSIHKYSYAFPQGAIVGTVAEVGIGYSGNQNNLFSRALLKDGNGNPTTITLLADEYLNVYYYLYEYPRADADIPFSIDISGVTYTGILQASDFVNSGQIYLQYDAAPVYCYNEIGNSISYKNPGYLPYVTNSHELQTGIATYTPNEGNLSIKVIKVVNSWYTNTYIFDTPLVKTDKQQLKLQFKFAWGRA